MLTLQATSYKVESSPMRTTNQSQERQKTRSCANAASLRIERSSMLASVVYHREQGQFCLPRPVAANLDWGTRPGP